MKLATALLATALFAAPALAATDGGKICIDPHWSYRANFLKGHQIVAQKTLGQDHRKLVLDTTCYNLDHADFISLATDFQCIDRGDDVFVRTLGDHHVQHCKITHVAPFDGNQG